MLSVERIESVEAVKDAVDLVRRFVDGVVGCGDMGLVEHVQGAVFKA